MIRRIQPKPISVDLPKVTLEEALDIVALQSKTFWIPVASNVILVAEDNTNNRRAYEDEVFKTFYLSNTVSDQDMSDVLAALRNTARRDHTGAYFSDQIAQRSRDA